MAQRDLNIVVSSLSGAVVEGEIRVQVKIFRLEDDPNWALEVVNEAGTSTVWNEPFSTDVEARAEFERTIREEGLAAFVDSAKIIPFPRRS